MRVRIRAALSGISGGISLSRFVPGMMYDVDPRTAAQLISMGAEFVTSTTSALVVPLDEPTLTDEQLTGGITVIQPLDLAADQPPRRRRKKS